MALNQGPQPAVISNENGVRYIDPNPTDQIVNHEDLVVYVKLVAKSKGRSILTDEGTTVEIENELRNVKSETNFTYTTGKNYIDTDWTNIGGGPQPLGSDLGAFGITNINIEFKSSFMPQITIDFVDVRGASLFEQGPCSPYSIFFHLPYPTFELTVKGYYGRPVTYTLALTKFNTKFNSETGNFESKGEFVGYTYAFLADIPMGYVLAANYMRGDFNGPQVLQNKWTNTVDREEFNDDYYGLNKDEPLTIFDLIVKSKKLETELPKLKNTTQVLEVSQLARIRNELQDLKSVIEEYARELLKVITISSTSGVRVGAQGERKTLYYIRLPKGTNTSLRIKDVATLNKQYISTSTPPDSEGFGSGRIGVKLSVTEGVYLINKEQGSAPKIEYSNIANDCSGFLSTELKENSDFPDFDEYSIDIWTSLLKPVEEALVVIDEKYKAKREEVQKQLNDAVRAILGFWPSIRNVFAVITTNTEVFLELLAQCSDDAERYHDTNDVQVGLGSGGAGSLLDLKNKSGAQSTTQTQEKVYPWPTYYVTVPKADGTEDDSGDKETFPGENPEFAAWPEVRFVEEFIIALTELRVDLQNLEITELEGEPGFDDYAPITAFETHAFGEEKAPNRWIGIQNGVPNVDELIDSFLCVAGENAFLLGDYSMINSLTVWKSQLGFDNGWGFNFETNGRSKDLITGVDVNTDYNDDDEEYADTDFGFTTVQEAAANGTDIFKIGPQRLVDNPRVIAPNSNFKYTRRYNGKGFNRRNTTYNSNGNAFTNFTANQWKIAEPKTGVGGGDKIMSSFATKISPTTRKKMRVWGRVDALNALQTLASDGQTDLLIEIRAKLNLEDASGLKDLIKEALKEKYNANFNEESFTDWKSTTTAEINDGTPATEYIDKQIEIWGGHFSYVKDNKVLTLKGPIPLNYSEVIGNTEISANPHKNPFGGVRLLPDSEKTNRTISLSTETGRLVGGSDGFLNDNYGKNYGIPKSNSNSSSGGGGLVDSETLSENTSGDITALTFGTLQIKPKYTKKPTDDDQQPSPYYRGSDASGDDTVVFTNNYNKIDSEAADSVSLGLDENLNMLTYDIKSHAPLFYLTQKNLSEKWGDEGVMYLDLGSSRVLYSSNYLATKPKLTDPGSKSSVKNQLFLDVSRFTDFVSTVSNNDKGSADAFVQTPLWTVNYPANKNPIYGSDVFIAEFENVSKSLNRVNPTSSITNGGFSTKMNTQSAVNVTRNFSTWWGCNSYYDDGEQMDGTKYVLPLAYLAVMGLGHTTPSQNFDSDGPLPLNQAKTGYFTPNDGNNIEDEGSFSCFGHTHVVAETPKAWLLMLGACLWRASEGYVLGYDWGASGNAILPTGGLENLGWNRLNDSRNIRKGTNNIPLPTNDMSDPVWFFHTSTSKPRQLNGVIPTITTSISDAPTSWGGNWYTSSSDATFNNDEWPNVNQYITSSYRRRYLGSDPAIGVDRWTDSGGPSQYSAPFRKSSRGPNDLRLVNGNVQQDHLMAGNPIGPWKNTLGGQLSDDRLPVDGLPYPPLTHDINQDEGFWLKTHNPTLRANGSVSWISANGLDYYGDSDYPDQYPIPEKNPVLLGLFDQCRQDQLPFFLYNERQRDWVKLRNKKIKDDLASGSSVVSGIHSPIRDDRTLKNIWNEFGNYRSNQFPSTLVLLDTSYFGRTATGGTVTVDGKTIENVNSPSLTKNGYLNLKQNCKELMFLPNSFKLELINYFKNWAINEAIESGDKWLRQLDTLNFNKKLKLGQNPVKTTRLFTEWADSGGGQQGYTGYLGNEFIRIKNGTIYKNKGTEEVVQPFEKVSGNFNEINFYEKNPWLVNYGHSLNQISGLFNRTTYNFGEVGSPYYEPDTSFVTGSKINLNNGNTINIEEITKGQSIMSYNLENKNIEESIVIETKNYIVNNLIIVELENGLKLNSTDDHPYFVINKGWSVYTDKNVVLEHLGSLKKLNVNDKILYYKDGNFKQLKIKSIFESQKQKRVFSIKTKNNKNYFVGGVLVST